MRLLWTSDWTPVSDRPWARRLLLVRHGRTEWNADGRFQGQADVPLDELGREQAEALARHVTASPHYADVGTIVSSDLVRAADTARALAEALGLDVAFDARLREIDVGSWSGSRLEQIAAREEAAGAQSVSARIAAGGDPPRGGDGETLAALRARVSAALDDALAGAPGGTVMIVAHGGVVRTVGAILLGLSDRVSGRLSAGGNTGVTEFRLSADGPRLVRWNDTSHLRS